MINNRSIAVLMTCHNRREKTLMCLELLSNSSIPEEYFLDIYLVDDGSTDGTSDTVKNNFPEVKIIEGKGDLYWNKGMRLAWETASQNRNYDYYLWLNDDTFIDENAIFELLECSNEAQKKDRNFAIIVGVCRHSVNKNKFSYGGRTDKGPLIPNGMLQSCKFINGNIVLVPKQIYLTIGILSDEYTHSLGDYDYGLNAIKAGYKCYITKKYIATCPKNRVKPASFDPQTPFIKRWKLLYSPKGLNIKEYLHYKKKHFGKKWILNLLSIYLTVIYPKFYKPESTKLKN